MAANPSLSSLFCDEGKIAYNNLLDRDENVRGGADVGARTQWPSPHVRHFSKEGARELNSSVDLDERGKQLRRDIEQFYSRLQSTNSLGVGIAGANDISEFIAKYIPKGISFDDAEQILRSAGLGVSDRPDIDVSSQRNDKADVVATMLLPARPWSRVELIVNLRPRAPGDYSSVGEVVAVIIVIYL